MSRKAIKSTASPAMVDSPAPPVFDESIGGALIDAARISVMGASRLLPPPEAFTQIVLPGEDPMPTTHECLDQAMAWLNAARGFAIQESGVPPTSIHVVASDEPAPRIEVP